MLRLRLFIPFGLAFFTAFVLCSGAPAQTPSPATTSPLPSDVELDALLSARNWDGLEAALSRSGPTSEFARKLNWLKTRMDSGGGFLLALHFARNFWITGSGLKIDDPAKDPRVTAGLYTLYAFELITIDGARCKDRSAPDNRISQLLADQAATLAFLTQQKPDLRAKIVDVAIALERKTAPLRMDDDLICRNGMEEMKASLEKGTQQEVPNKTGHFGKTISVTPPPDWAPRFVSPDVYRPMQEKARASMREILLKLVGLS
jgi:hypothetical protein